MSESASELAIGTYSHNIVDEAIGMAISIKIDPEMIEQMRALPAKHYRDVVIEFNGREVEMTFEDFLQRVGLSEQAGGG